MTKKIMTIIAFFLTPLVWAIIFITAYTLNANQTIIAVLIVIGIFLFLEFCIGLLPPYLGELREMLAIWVAVSAVASIVYILAGLVR